jgi:hypothetical protein
MSTQTTLKRLKHHREQARRIYVEGRSGLSDSAYRHYCDLHHTLDEAVKKLEALESEPISPDDLRELGWVVAVHNDYRLDSEAHTFWLFTKNGRCIKGEGKTDAIALKAVMEQALSSIEGETP